MKKIIAFALALVLCVSLLSVSAMAAESGYMTISSATAEVGQTVYLAVGLYNNPGAAGIYVDVVYDADLLEKVSYAGTGMNGTGVWTCIDNCIWDNSGDVAYDGQILTLAFKVKDTAKVGDVANVTINYTVGNWDGELVAGGSATGTVTVACTHEWGNGVVTKAATCTETGLKTYTCSICGETKEEVIPTIAHDMETEWTYNNDKHWHKCSVCGAIADEADHINDVTGQKIPTAEEDGYRIYGCVICGRYDHTEPWAYGEPPKVGDIRPMMALGFAAVLFTMAAAAYVFKRKVNF